MRPRRFQLPLDQKESSRLYWELSRRGAFCTGEREHWKYHGLSEEELFTLALLQARYDPRLLAVLVDFFQKPSHKLNPVVFKHCLRKADALSIAAVVGEYVLESSAADSAKEFFRFLMTGVTPVPLQLFYRGLYRIGGKQAQEVLQRPLWAFKKWGYLATDPPFLKERDFRKRIYLFDQASRLNILQEWAKGKERFRLKDYLKEVGFSISRQQALKDLKALNWIRQSGHGKGTYYEVASVFGS